MWLLLVPRSFAQETPDDVRFNGQVLRPSPDSTSTLWTEDTRTAPDGTAMARALVHFAHAPVRWRGEDGESDRLVTNSFGMDLLGALRWREIRIGVHVPTYLVADGVVGDAEPGLGDIGLDLKGTVLHRDSFPVGLAVMGRLGLPTASIDVPLGSASTSWELIVVADKTIEDATVAMNLGTRGNPRATFQDMVWDDQLFARVGVGYPLTDTYGVAGELAAQTNWASKHNPAGSAVELLGTGYYKLQPDIFLRGGLSFGLSRSPGAPVTRWVAGISWEPDPTPDRDLDGVVDKLDRCPGGPEDADDYADEDGCPDPSYTIDLAVTGRRGDPLTAALMLEGPDQVTLPPGERYIAVHPGKYTVRAEAPGYLDWTGTIEVPERQGEQFPIPMRTTDSELRIWAYDPSGNRVEAAKVRVSGGSLEDADGEPLRLDPGEHALLVAADGFLAKSLSVELEAGDSREVSVVLDPAPPPSPPPPVSVPAPAPVPPPIFDPAHGEGVLPPQAELRGQAAEAPPPEIP
jgi:hypothetical protein